LVPFHDPGEWSFVLQTTDSLVQVYSILSLYMCLLLKGHLVSVYSLAIGFYIQYSKAYLFKASVLYTCLTWSKPLFIQLKGWALSFPWLVVLVMPYLDAA
jgi:hypothetical protein